MATLPERYQAENTSELQQNVLHQTKLDQLSTVFNEMVTLGQLDKPKLAEMMAQLQQDAKALTASASARVQELASLKKHHEADNTLSSMVSSMPTSEAKSQLMGGWNMKSVSLQGSKRTSGGTDGNVIDANEEVTDGA